MRQQVIILCLAAVITVSASPAPPEAAQDTGKYANHRHPRWHRGDRVQLGPRPFFLVNDMEDGRLKRRLQRCSAGPFRKTDFSIGHRGAALQFPEHTRESYEAAARMGAGIVECDVTFTQDLELVCRHSQGDLHTTTNILLTPLASKCAAPFTPAVLGPDGSVITPATAECRTSDITLAELKQLTGKMEAFNPAAQTPEEFVGGTPSFRTDLYVGPTSGHLLSHKESIALFKRLGVKMTPELKAPSVTMPFNGFTQEAYAQKMIDEYKEAGVSPRDVWPQSFSQEDVLYWVQHEPAFGRQAVYLDDANDVSELPSFAELVDYKSMGINIVAPPTFALLALDERNEIVPSQYARDAKRARLDIITWTLERSGTLADGDNGFYFQTIDAAITREGDLMTVLDVLARDVGIMGVFSDWAAPVTYYANCMGLQ
ncbi:MAG: glycerophosphodiester phosphodiesterase [Luteitalea sp.]|nr:glycerophosphodiester phosphodiesterase [Luteitalea sp.]